MKMEEALRLRQRYMTYRQIANHMGVDVHTAHDYVKDALKLAIRENVEDVKRMELARIEEIERALLPVAMNRDHVRQARSAEVLLKYFERKSALLGLDAPTRRIVDVVTHDKIDQAIEEMEREIGEREARSAAGGEPGAVGALSGAEAAS